MIAASPLSGCPLAKPATENWRWPSDGKGITIGSTIGHHESAGCVAMLYRASGRKSRSPQRHTYTRECHRLVPFSPNPPRSSGVTIVGPTTAIATHNLAEPLCPKRVATPLTSGCVPGPDIATVLTCPTPVCTHTAKLCTINTHTAWTIVLCVSFGDPHVHKVTPPDETMQECNHSNANTLGPIHHVAMTHQTDDKSKGRKKKGVHQQRVLC